MPETKCNLKGVCLTALISGALSVAGGFQINRDMEYRESLKTPQVVEIRSIASDISDPYWVNNNRRLYEQYSRRYAQLLEDEGTRININELTRIETEPAKGYTFPLVLAALVFFYSGVITLGETIDRTGRFIKGKIKKSQKPVKPCSLLL